MNGVTHKDLVVKLMRDAAIFFTSIGEQNPGLTGQMEENARVFRGVADMVEIDHASLVDNGKTVAELAAALMGDAAAFFRSIGEQNPPLATQMNENAEIFRKLGILIVTDPLGSAEDEPATKGMRRKDPVAHMRQKASVGAATVDPQFGLSYPCRGNPRPMRTLAEAPSDEALTAAVVARDDHSCRYCGFQSLKYQQAVAPFGAFSVSQMHTACMFCAQVAALDKASAMNSGVLVWLPELSQAALNSWMRVVHICRIDSVRGDEARTLLQALMERRDEARRRFGTDDPAHLARQFASCASPEAYRTLLVTLQGLRLLPLDRRNISEGELRFNQFPQILAYWRSKEGPAGTLRPADMELGPLFALAGRIEAERGVMPAIEGAETTAR